MIKNKVLIIGFSVIALAGVIYFSVTSKSNDNNTIKENSIVSDTQYTENEEEIIKNTEEKENSEESTKNDEIKAKIKGNPNIILVNKENLLDDTFVPENLVFSEIEFLSYIETRNLTQEAADAAKMMFDAAKVDGITLLGASGYRSYDIQVSLFNGRAAEVGEEAASLYTAPPGASEHQTGLALDILGADYQFLDDGFDQSESFKWLADNCAKYGFILRYLKGKEDITGFGYEPWHFRYIGDSEIAQEIMDKGITLEEYLQEVNQ